MISAVAAGCSSPSIEESDDTEGAISVDIDAASPRLDAVGAIVETINAVRGHETVKCSATLIGPHTVLTAAHCVEKYILSGKHSERYGKIEFRVGPDPMRPKRAFRVVSSGFAQPRTGSAGLGVDIGVMQLAEDVVGIEPLGLAQRPLSPSSTRSDFYSVGYGGEQGADMMHKTKPRHIGHQSLIALSGNPLVKIYGDYDGFVRAARAVAPAADPQEIEANWNQFVKDQEGNTVDAIAGFYGYYYDRSTLVCNGDSGGPVLRFGEDGKPTIVGVHSFVPAVTVEGRPHCFGGIAAGLVTGEGVRKAVADALADSRRGLPAGGTCSANDRVHATASSIAIEACGDQVCSDGKCGPAPEPSRTAATAGCTLVGHHTAGTHFLPDGHLADVTDRSPKPRGSYAYADNVLELLEGSSEICADAPATYLVEWEPGCRDFTYRLVKDACPYRAEDWDGAQISLVDVGSVTP